MSPQLLDLTLGFINWLPNHIQNLQIGKIGLQGFGLLIGMVLNYSGQRFWIYTGNPLN
jgi:hypothetical protein